MKRCRTVEYCVLRETGCPLIAGAFDTMALLCLVVVCCLFPHSQLCHAAKCEDKGRYYLCEYLGHEKVYLKQTVCCVHLHRVFCHASKKDFVMFQMFIQLAFCVCLYWKTCHDSNILSHNVYLRVFCGTFFVLRTNYLYTEF